METPHVMTVTVWKDKTKEGTYRDIVAIGVGHVKPSLVLVERKKDFPEKVIEVMPDFWNRYSVRKRVRK